jgi:FkbM family methyltransferase
MNSLASIHDSSLFLKVSADDVYDIARRDGGLCIDGGAAAGFVTKRLLGDSTCRVMAFEPFAGNVPHFRRTVGNDRRVTFFQAALGRYSGTGAFYVDRVVDSKQAGWGNLAGYSSEGHLVPTDFKAKKGQAFEVDVVRLEDILEESVTLLKLDLQGGEFDALEGLGAKVSSVHYCYVEFSLDWRTLDYFRRHDFVVFDTPYTGIPKVPIEVARTLFDAPKVIDLSNGYQAVSGVIQRLPRDLVGYREFLVDFKEKHFHHLWSDLIAVNRRHLRSFFSSALL